MNSKQILHKACISSLLITSLFGCTMIPDVSFASNIHANQQNPILKTPSGIADFQKGNASIQIIPNDNQSLLGKDFMVYPLLYAQNSQDLESINYTWNETYKPALQQLIASKLQKDANTVTEFEVIDYIQSLNSFPVQGANASQTLEASESQFRYFIQDLRKILVDMNLEGTMVSITEVDSDNKVTLTGLEYGYYVIDEISENEGDHSASSLCMVSTANPNSMIQIKSDYPTISKKIYEDDHNIGWNDIGDYEIGQTIDFQYETKTPNMNGYSQYYFNFHDKMDSALTFHPETISITIQDDTKTYTLTSEEMNLLEPTNDETFQIEIKDLKNIVDREFGQTNTINHDKIYGQQMTFHYQATLNDLAANDTGRPGFENHVQLEFSNNPDSDGTTKTGRTPWDSVVCFTYQIKGLKLNEHQKVLEGAKFRLYSDSKCENEVILKQTDNGYHVVHSDSSNQEKGVEIISNKDGIFNIIGLDQGTYWLKETFAPKGYRKLLDPIQIDIIPTFTQDRNSYIAHEGSTDKILQSLDAKATIKEFKNGVLSEQTLDLETNVDEGSMNISIVNTTGSKLPVTGSQMTIVMLGIGSVLVVGSIRYSKKSKSKSL